MDDCCHNQANFKRDFQRVLTWKGCGTADASTCSREPLQSVSHGSSSGTWQTLLGNPGDMQSQRLSHGGHLDTHALLHRPYLTEDLHRGWHFLLRDLFILLFLCGSLSKNEQPPLKHTLVGFFPELTSAPTHTTESRASPKTEPSSWKLCQHNADFPWAACFGSARNGSGDQRGGMLFHHAHFFMFTEKLTHNCSPR